MSNYQLCRTLVLSTQKLSISTLKYTHPEGPTGLLHETLYQYDLVCYIWYVTYVTYGMYTTSKNIIMTYLVSPLIRVMLFLLVLVLIVWNTTSYTIRLNMTWSYFELLIISWLQNERKGNSKKIFRLTFVFDS